jgi:hypothetical protein
MVCYSGPGKKYQSCDEAEWDHEVHWSVDWCEKCRGNPACDTDTVDEEKKG